MYYLAIDYHKKLINENEPFDKEIAHRMELIRHGLKNSSSIAKLNQIGSSKPYPSSLKLQLDGIVPGPLVRKTSENSAYNEIEKRIRQKLDPGSARTVTPVDLSSLNNTRSHNPLATDRSHNPLATDRSLRLDQMQRQPIYVQLTDRGAETSRSQYFDSILTNPIISPGSNLFQRDK